LSGVVRAILARRRNFINVEILHEQQPEGSMISQTLRTQYRVGDFVTWQREGALDLNPNFQRRPVWKKGAKSYLIDTIVRGLPMPIIFLRDLRTDLRTLKSRRDVVDGQQRIRTILSFIDPNLLPDFEPARDSFKISSVHNEELGGKAWPDLGSAEQQTILDYQFSVHSFPSDTDDREILQIFARMNSTGMKLNAQELRNAEFYGRFKTVAYELATEQLNRWRDWKVFTPDQIARMNEVELTSEFLTLIMAGVLTKNNATIDHFYKEFDEEFSSAAQISGRFRTTFDALELLISPEIITRYFSTRTLFFALFATVYGLLYGLLSPPRKPPKKDDLQSLPRTKAAKINSEVLARIQQNGEKVAKRAVPERVQKAVRGATTDGAQRRVLIDFLAGEDSPCRRMS
jgi:hypothetical protein